MSKHTPGPWDWYGPNLLCGGERQSENILNSADDGKRYGHHAALIEHHWDGDVAKANARLIAAAPELLEALKRIESAVDWYLGRSSFTQTTQLKGLEHSASVRKELFAAHDKARAAIKAAEEGK